MVSSVQHGTSASAAAPPEVMAQSCGASPEARMLALMVYAQVVQADSAQTSVKLNESQLKELRAAIKEAIEAAREANEDSGFWGDIGDALGGDIATLAQVVAVAAACVVSGGTAAVLLGAIAIACSVVSSHAEELGIPPQVALGIGIAGAVAGVASGNVGAAGGLAGAASTTSTASTACTAATQTSQVVETAAKVGHYAQLVGAAAQGSGAAANGVSGYYASEAVGYKADETKAKGGAKLEDLEIDEALDQFERAIDLQLAACQSTQDIAEAKQQSSQLILMSFSGAA
jgi:hypothetical protein